MTEAGHFRIPRWLTGVLMFTISFLLLFTSFIFSVSAVLHPTQPELLIIASTISMMYYFITILVCWCLWVFVDSQPPEGLGVHFMRGWWRGLLIGLILGGVMMFAIIVVELFAGWVSLTPPMTPEQLGMAQLNLGVYAFWQALVAVGEELVSRGYIQQNLNTRFSKPLAVTFAAMMFAALHLPRIMLEALPLPLVVIMVSNMFLGGVLLGWAFIKSHSLWLPIGIHYAWNFVQYHVVGYGGNGFYNVYNLGLEILTGGSFGPEAGLVGTIAFVLLILIVWQIPPHLVTNNFANAYGKLFIYNSKSVEDSSPLRVTDFGDTRLPKPDLYGGPFSRMH